RPKGSKEGGANVVGEPSRADTILLIRAGGGASSRLAIPRDTVVEIPGHGRDKINASFAIGGPALTITTVKEYLGIDINHVMEVNLDNFPDFIDAMGGINVSDVGCVRANVDGTDEDGGTTINIKAGETVHLDGKHVLGLARVRTNTCDNETAAGENDTDRAARQQKILGAIKRRLISPPTFLRLPWVSWNAPKAVRTDMNGLSLLGLFAAIQTASTPAPSVLKPSGSEATPDGGSGLHVDGDEKRAAVRKFLEG
ncbi:MAG: LCP family protein, partial [Solirubrobacteraceae bacterium]